MPATGREAGTRRDGPGSGDAPDRLSAPERREALLDVTKQLVLEGGPRAATMGTVAERAEVTRALVYKHFANRDDLLGALHQRESTRLDRHLARTVAAAPDGLEAKLRAFIHGVVESMVAEGSLFDPLRGLGVDGSTRRDRRSWDRRTVGYFAGLAADELSLDETTARQAISMLFSGVGSVVAQVKRHPGRESRAHLEDVFVTSVRGALAQLAADDPRRPRS